MATVTVIAEPWEHPCAGEQAWEASPGLQVWPWAERSRGCSWASSFPPAPELPPTWVSFRKVQLSLGSSFSLDD